MENDVVNSTMETDLPDNVTETVEDIRSLASTYMMYKVGKFFFMFLLS